MTMITNPKLNRPSGSFWTLHREATLNWLALGMLLAAWNASDSETRTDFSQRPQALRGYAQVSVRAANRAGATATPM
jgi:hypothetical protein